MLVVPNGGVGVMVRGAVPVAGAVGQGCALIVGRLYSSTCVRCAAVLGT